MAFARGAGRPSTTHPPGTRRGGARAYLASFARVRNVLEVVTRPRGSLATRSAMREGRASRTGASVALPESAGFPPDLPFADAEGAAHEHTWRSGLIFLSDDDDVSESRFVNRQTGPSLRPNLGIGSGKEIHTQMWHAVWTGAARETKISKIFLQSPPVIGQERRDFRFSLVPRMDRWRSEDCPASARVSARSFTASARRGRSSTSRRFSYRSRGCRYAFSPSRHQALVALDAASPFASRRSDSIRHPNLR